MTINGVKGGIYLRSLYKVIFLFLIVVVAGIYINHLGEERNDIMLHSDEFETIEEAANLGASNLNSDIEPRPTEGISLLIGQHKTVLKEKFGVPNRIDPSSYGYDWWVYNDSFNEYMQVGVEEDYVVTVFVCGESINIEPFTIGQSLGDIYSTFLLEPEVGLQLENSSYRFELTEEDINVRPLIRLDNIFAQLYIDKFTGKLSSVRFVDGPTLIKQRSYELVYRGNLYNVPQPTDEQWELVENANEMQIFEITNILRERFNVPTLQWNDNVAQVAFGHSKDMHDEQYFSHESPQFGNLADRLERANIHYQVAGENIISAQYIDAPGAVASWLNSKSHRDTMLEGTFSHLGVGVYRNYYTQNFIKEWLD